MLDEVAELEGIKGIMLTFDDFVEGIENFGTRIQPLMKSRNTIQPPQPDTNDGWERERRAALPPVLPFPGGSS